MGGKALLARHAELTVHLAPHLGRDAQRGTILIRYKDRFHKAMIASLVEVLHRTIHRAHRLYGGIGAHLIVLLQQVSLLQGEVGHLVDARHPFLIEPRGHLLGGKLWQPQGRGYLL